MPAILQNVDITGTNLGALLTALREDGFYLGCPASAVETANADAARLAKTGCSKCVCESLDLITMARGNDYAGVSCCVICDHCERI